MKKLETRLKAYSYPYPVKHICLDFACHMRLVNANRGTKLVAKSERQHPQECVDERKMMGEEMLKWVRTVWG